METGKHYRIAKKSRTVKEPWKALPGAVMTIKDARRGVDEGTHIMTQAREEDHFYLIVVKRKALPVLFDPYFSAPLIEADRPTSRGFTRGPFA